ncbi:MAG: hypothetical protein WC455_19415 [Dehalococcoidia bacterium]|jgi:hypothetical protein
MSIFIKVIEAGPSVVVLSKGDLPGHEFHGNQYGEGFGSGGNRSAHRFDLIAGRRFVQFRLENGKTVILREPKSITVQGKPGWSGIEVNKEGDDIIPRGATERLHMIQETAIINAIPMAMNNKYGELEHRL